uniref:Uncharacterized protein n=1 Tax=Panagrolaimus davidi TaxID=227884 RepID=A0A914PN86_9BILA
MEQITYESTVILVDILTKIRSPLLKIKTTQTQFKNVKTFDKIPVSEMHQCSFQFIGSNGYMTSDPTNNLITEFQSFAKNDEIPQWFIVSADLIKHQFYAINGLIEGFCIKKFPHIFECLSDKFDPQKFVKFVGENFSTKLEVWIGSFQCKIKAICNNSVEFYLPTLETYKNHCQNYGIASSIVESAPIMFMNENGIIFHTFFSYYFTGKEEIFDYGLIYRG